MGVITHSFSKDSAEDYTKTITYTDRLPSGAAVSSAAVASAIDLHDGSDVSATVVGTLTTAAAAVNVPFPAGGTDGHTYRVKINATLDNGNNLVDLLNVTVCDRPL